MKSKRSLAFTLLSGLVLGASSLSTAQAAVIVDLPTSTEAGSIQFTQDINFTITTSGTLAAVAFDEWVTSDGGFTDYAGSNFTPNLLNYSLNGGNTLTASISNLRDNVATTLQSLTPNDGFLRFGNITVDAGDVFTIKAGSYELAAGSLPASFNPQTEQTFNGNLFVTTPGGIRLDGITVPEPSAALLGCLGMLALLRRRR